MTKLEATLSEDQFTDLDESLRDNYIKEEDGVYRLSVLSNYTPNDQIEDVSGLKSALSKERENAKNAQRQLSQIKGQFEDVDPDRYQQLLEAEQKREEDAAKKAGEYDKLIQQVNEKHGQELNKRSDREQHLIGVIKQSKIDSEVVSALNSVGGNVNLLLPHVKSQMELVEEDGQFHARVIDESGTVRVNGEGKYMTAKELVSEMRDSETFSTAFEADVKSGGGTPPGGDGGGNGSTKKGVIPSDLKRSVMTPRQKVDFITEHGNDEFLKLPL